MIKRHFLLLGAAVLVGLMTVAVVMRLAFADDGGARGGQGGPGGPGGRAQMVSDVAAELRTFSDEIRVIGVARGQRSLNITSPTSQLITEVHFRDGQRVRAGQPLIELQARAEEAEVLQARVRVAQAESQYERYRELGERGFAPAQMIEQFRTELETARAILAAAEARRGDRVIRAPFPGIMGLSTVTPGTYVAPGAVIATLDDIDVIRVDFPVPARLLGVLRVGAPLTATVDSYGDAPFTGRIALIDTRVNEQTRAVTARAEIPNPGVRIRPGMAVRVAVAQGERQAAAVPEAAVLYEGQGAFVYRIAPSDEGNVAQRVEVETGAVADGYVEIVSGLNIGDRIVGSGLNRIQPGAPVRTADAAGRGPRG
ncbi:MAG: efflux RND transporter periplasmic adaptor subunit [Brevundimonas sp.]|uniref:efflux RND transporter periplasmic adaptor subunit n=1 Tax=Brevundimonas sp. TaxID=1871086 RepID=UPI0022BED39F|nr:efflux RND transporter periplasmic adaptor subunit [Brevundimonas sp.]